MPADTATINELEDLELDREGGEGVDEQRRLARLLIGGRILRRRRRRRRRRGLMLTRMLLKYA